MKYLFVKLDLNSKTIRRKCMLVIIFNVVNTFELTTFMLNGP